eukprot:397746_1
MVNNKKKRSKQKKAQRTKCADNNSNASRSSNGSLNAARGAPSAIHHSPQSSDVLTLQDIFEELSVEDILRIFKSMEKRQQQQQLELDDHVIFTRKLKGAFARLFAKGCESYLENVVMRCFDAP